jgi:L,D-transpeptidase ErfK/SrfK
MIPILAAAVLLAQIWGGPTNYLVQPGDSLTSIGARLGIDVKPLAELNDIKPAQRLVPGSELKINNPHIVSFAPNVDIVINLPQRMLFFFEAGRFSRGYPITAGSRGWKTPPGDFTVVTMEKDPTWDVPPSIQAEMSRAGKPVLTRVPPSPQNPLGKYWIGLSLSGIGIHGTNAPGSIYRLVSHGCIRLHPDDIAELFPRVQGNMHGRIIYEPVLLAENDGVVFLEVHPDVYRKVPDMLARAKQLAQASDLANMVDWELVKEVIHKRDGIARDVTRY